MLKILYLEDNPQDIELTQLELKKIFSDVTIDNARTIKQAHDFIAEENRYDVVILDLRLPDGNGLDILLEIRNSNLDLPVIILTGSGNEESAIAAIKAGADDYIAKDFEYLNKLPGVIKKVLENFKHNANKKVQSIHVLYIEWNKSDIDLTIRHMHKYAPFITISSVYQSSDALELLPKDCNSKCVYDVLLMDYRLHGLDALDTIKIIKQERNLKIPIVLVTGQGSEQIAVQALKFGADEYLVKRKNYLYRLPSLITNAYQRFKLEQQQFQLRKSEARYRLLADNSGDVISVFDMKLNYVYVSPAVKHLRGYNVEETLQQNLRDILTPESFKYAMQEISKYVPAEGIKLAENISPKTLELEMITKDGSTIWTEVKASIALDDNKIPVGIQTVTRDISKRKKALEDLVKSREEYKSFFEDDLTGDFISTSDGKIITCNPAYLNIMGFKSLEEVQKYDLNKLYTDRDARARLLKEIEKKKRLNSHSLDLIRPDGKLIHTSANLIGVFDQDNKLESIKGYLIDDTDRKKAMNELRKLSRAIEQSPVSVIITNTKGDIEYVNPKFSEVTGYSFEEVYGNNPRILKSDSTDPDIYKSMWETITGGKSWYGEFQNKRKDGSLLWENVSISPVLNEEKVTHYIAVKEDITEKKLFEEELIIARDKAEESSKLKSAFLATMSHELRTPLNAIIGFSGLIDKTQTMSSVVEFSEIINKSGIHLLNIIEDIFTISMLQTGDTKVDYSEFIIADLIKSLVYNANIEKKNKEKDFLNIIVNQPINDSSLIRSDKTKLFQILINFIKNAIAYTEQGEIELGYSVSNRNIEFYVKDSGIGIQENKLDVIFERFRQIDQSQTRKYGGVGLGLAICKEIAQILHGKIRLESKVGEGSTFYFALDDVIVETPEQATSRSKIVYPDLSNKTILIVEDEESNYLLLNVYLQRTKATIIWSKNGEESIEICKRNSGIDLVLMDIRMPGINGIEAASRIKEIRPDLTIIAQTAFALTSDKNEILNSECDDYISKPIKLELMIDLLNRYLVSNPD
jgi:PAS domain S-box-containing protein